jgi:cation diffusion facilitator CzcD-associated flavoprotein CzcO
MHEEKMNAQHFDVLVIGAGLSGIGTARQVRAAHPNKTLATQTSEIHTLPRKVATI